MDALGILLSDDDRATLARRITHHQIFQASQEILQFVGASLVRLEQIAPILVRFALFHTEVEMGFCIVAGCIQRRLRGGSLVVVIHGGEWSGAGRRQLSWGCFPER